MSADSDLFARPQGGERAILIHTRIGRGDPDRQAEFTELALSAGASPVHSLNVTRARPEPKYFIGTGKAGDVARAVEEQRADLVLVDHTLSPAQERNLERLTSCRVLDRAGLILDIFAQRARSHEGKLQVELAQLEHLSTRLVRGWSHLERQKGGIGLRGPGEKQLETDRRLLATRIRQIRRRLQKVRSQRQQGRQARHKAAMPTVALVGYTNAGKSTLFNALTQADVYSADQLFATLDPTLRRLELEHGPTVVLADTVGFISDLPHALIDAFHATLEEVRKADLLLHVIDASDEDRLERIEQVNLVLREIGAAEVAQLEVMNKIDRLDEVPRADRDERGLVRRVWVSAVDGTGFEQLHSALAARLGGARLFGQLELGPADGRVRGWLHEHNAVVDEQASDEGGWCLSVEVDEVAWRVFAERAGMAPERLHPLPGGRLAASS